MPSRAHTFRKPAAGKMLAFGRWEHFKRPFSVAFSLVHRSKTRFYPFLTIPNWFMLRVGASRIRPSPARQNTCFPL